MEDDINHFLPKSLLVIVFVLVNSSLLCYNTMTKSNSQSQWLTSHYSLWPIIHGSQDRNSRQTPGGKGWKRSHGGLMFIDFLPTTFSDCLVAPRVACQGVASSPVRLPHQPSTKTIPQACSQASLVSLVEAFAQLRFSLPKWLYPMSIWQSISQHNVYPSNSGPVRRTLSMDATGCN